MTHIDKSKPVLVTGGSGYVASWIIKLLLEEGINVRTTVRDKSKKEKYQHLLEIAKTSSASLEIFEADLLKDGTFTNAMQSCELIMHTASPFQTSGINDAQKQLIDPALKGTQNVLKSANLTSGLKKVVLTSSVAAMYGDAKDFQQLENGAFTEEHWNTTSSLKHGPYSFSKTLAEQSAWEIARLQDQWELVVVNPSFVLGPSLTKRTDSLSIEIMSNMGNGTYKNGGMELWFGVVDVRDVAKAHFQAGFKPSASGRHILCSDSIPLLEIANILREKYGNKYPFPKMNVPKILAWLIAPMFGMTRKYVAKNVAYPVKFDNSYTKKDLEMEFRPINETVLDHFQQLITDQLI